MKSSNATDYSLMDIKDLPFVKWPFPPEDELLGEPDEELKTAIRYLYDAVLEDRNLEKALKAIRLAFKANAAQFSILKECENSKWMFLANFIETTEYGLIVLDKVAEYEAKTTEDPMAHLQIAMQGRTISSCTHLSEEHLNWRLARGQVPRELIRWIGNIHKNGEVWVTLYAMRGMDDQPFDLKDVQRFATITRDLERIRQICEAKYLIVTDNSSLIKNLDAFDEPIGVANGLGEIIHLNAMAKSILFREDLEVLESADLLEKAKEAVRNKFSHIETPNSRVEISKPDTKEDDNSTFFDYLNTKLVLRFVPNKAIEISVSERLSATFGLTKRESEVLIDLCDGKSIASIANQTKRSRETIRTQIKLLLNKIGVNSQVELVSRVSRMVQSK